MTVVVLSLLTAAAFGTGDFLGGMAAQRTSIVRVVGLAHLVGLTGVLAAAVVIDNVLIWGDVAIGAVGGAFGGGGVALLYRGLARGPMSVVAPVTAVSSAAVPALWGLVNGERPSAVVFWGLAVALVAIWLVSSVDDNDGLGVSDDESVVASTSKRSSLSATAEALAAGTGFGLFFILLDLTDPTSAPWAVVGARALTTTVLAVVLLAGSAGRSGGQGLRSTGGFATVALIVATGLLDTAANVMFLLALEDGSLAIVAVLTSLYPVATVLLAYLILNESMKKWQLAGFPLALVATCLIAIG